MPCGGIYPIKGSALEPYLNSKHPCWVCDKGNCDLVLEEWDAVIHSECVEGFINDKNNPEAQVILEHGHVVIILRDGKEVVLHEEKR
jgi:hypothetical protein